MQTLTEISEKLNLLCETKTRIQSEAREMIRNILQDKPELFISRNGGYAYVQEEEFVERAVVGIRLDKKTNTIEFTTCLDMDGDFNDFANFDEETYREDDDYACADWISILGAILPTLEKN